MSGSSGLINSNSSCDLLRVLADCSRQWLRAFACPESRLESLVSFIGNAPVVDDFDEAGRALVLQTYLVGLASGVYGRTSAIAEGVRRRVEKLARSVDEGVGRKPQPDLLEFLYQAGLAHGKLIWAENLRIHRIHE